MDHQRTRSRRATWLEMPAFAFAAGLVVGMRPSLDPGLIYLLAGGTAFHILYRSLTDPGNRQQNSYPLNEEQRAQGVKSGKKAA